MAKIETKRASHNVPPQNLRPKWFLFPLYFQMVKGNNKIPPITVCQPLMVTIFRLPHFFEEKYIAPAE